MSPASPRRRADDAFWRDSLRRYARPGVADACLALQDAHGADVNLVLWCCWLGSQGHRLDARTLRRAVRAVAAWQSEVVQPLRGVRRVLKPCDGLGPAAALRARVAALELRAEHHEQQILGRLAQALPAPGRRAEPDGAAAANLARYLAFLGVPGDAAGRAAGVLLAPRARSPAPPAHRRHTRHPSSPATTAA